VKLKFPASWTSGTQRTLLETWGEGTPVELEAYLIKTKRYPSGAEPCNPVQSRAFGYVLVRTFDTVLA
jgi:hypothetical protein